MTDVRRRAGRLGVQTAALLVLLLGVVLLVTLVAYERAENDDAERTLRAATDELDLGEVPPGFWALRVSAGRRAVSAPAPAGLPFEPDLARVLADRRPRQREVELASGTWFVRTSARGNGAVQVALDRTAAEETSARVVRALVVSATLGVLLAGGVAILLTRRALTPLAEALELQRRFVADAGHELRTPLTLLSTRVQLLNRRLAATSAAGSDAARLDALRSDLDGVLADTAALTRLLDDLLVSVDPGAPQPRTPVDVSAMVAACVAAAAPLAGSRGVTVSVEAAPPAVAPVSEAALRRAVTSLIDNALDHASSHVRLEVRPHRRRVEVVVTDDGPGVPDEDRERIFQRFASARPTAPAAPAGPGRRHYGLGLALVADVATAHDGSVRVRRRDDGFPGAQFVLTLPRHRA